MRKKFLTTLWTVSLCFLIFSSDAEAKVYIDVDSPTFQLFPIAVCDFNYADNNAAKSAEYGSVLSDDVKKYLGMTGFFNPLNKKSFLEDNKTGTSPGSIIDFSAWQIIGADYLMKGKAAAKEGQWAVEIWLYDVVRGELIFSKKYNVLQSEEKLLATSIASDILFSLTGDHGEFNTKIAFVAKKDDKADIYMVNYDGSDLQPITRHQALVVSPRWSPDGQFLAFTSFKQDRPEVYIRNLKNGSERKVASFVGLNLCGYWSPDGQKLLLTLSKDGDEELYVLEIATLKLRRLTDSFSIDVSPTWSPDGKRIAFVSNRGGSPQIYTMDADGSNTKRITFEGKYNTTPTWSPRGGRIAYEGSINGRFQIFTVDEEGNNLLQLTFDAADNFSPSWSPSGRQIVYISKSNARSKICIMNANGLNNRILYEDGRILAMPMWSPRFK